MSTNDTNPSFTPELTENLQRLLVTIRQRGIARVELAYDGREDSGGCCGVYAYDEEDAMMDLRGGATIDLLAAIGLNDPVTVECTLVDAFDFVVSNILSAYGFDGFENNDGGGGTITLNAEGDLQVGHYYRVVQFEEEERTTRITLPAPPVPPFDANQLVSQLPRPEPALNL